ncbi:MAG: hypothetical protein QNK37_04705 [Acidobacteriota bacterium]|nr:hypothetical protein [Acidobacteriota bacterium]
MPTVFYPPLTDILPVDALPEELGFLKDGVADLLSKVYFKDLQYTRNDRGDSAFYSLSIVSLKRIDIEIPGTEMFLILNPSHDAAVTTSSFPITLGYEWPVLAYLRNFDLAGFSFKPVDFFDLALAILDVSERDLIERVFNIFITAADPIGQFVADVNAAFGANLEPPDQTDPDPIGTLLKDIDDAAAVDNAGVAVFTVYLLDALSDGETEARLNQFFESFFGGDIQAWLKTLITPKIEATLDVNVALEFPRNVLTPLQAVGGDPVDNTAVKTQLRFDPGYFFFSTEKGIGFDANLELTLSHPSEIANTGLGIDFKSARLDLSRKTNIPEADADGRPADFVGVYIDEASISFPLFWNHDRAKSSGVVRGRNLLIGTGGVSGTFCLEAVTGGTQSPLIEAKFGKDFKVSLDAFCLVLKQNRIMSSEIKGRLTIPGFKDDQGNPSKIGIDVFIGNDGDFSITATAGKGKTIKFGDIFSIKITALFFGREGDDFYMGLSGSLKILHPALAGILQGDIGVEKLILWSDGRLEIQGGSLPLRNGVNLKLGPATITVTAIHMGSHQQEDGNRKMRQYRYFGFDGGLNLDPGGVDARGDGIKFYYSVDSGPEDRFLRVQSISLDLVIPGTASKDSATALIKGYLSIKGSGADKEYAGGVEFSLPKAKISGGASMKYKPADPSWIVDAFVELSTPIPLGSTGLGIFGFRGLVGLRYVASKDAVSPPVDTWFDYYKAPPKEGVDVEKFAEPSQTGDMDNPFSVGAGITLGTSTDDGYTFSLKLFVLLSLPEVFYLEGKANVLGERVGLTGEDPPFFAFLAISRDSVETGFGADYAVPKDTGAMLDIFAEIQAAFFFRNSSAWFVNFGTKEKRITARVLSLFEATSYLMLSASGIAAGAGITFGFSKNYAGIVRASVEVYIEVGGHISFEKPQIGAYALLGGHVDIYLFFFGFHISIDTSLAVEAPKPFLIQGSVKLCVGVTIGFWKFKKTIEKCFEVSFIWELNKNVDRSPVNPMTLPASNDKDLPAVGMNIQSGESFGLFYRSSRPSVSDSLFDAAVIPLDTWIDIEFKKGLDPGDVTDRIGGTSNAPHGHLDLIPPNSVGRQVRHAYSLKLVEIKAWNGQAWVEYKPYEALLGTAALTNATPNPGTERLGFWQKTGLEYNKLRLLAETPLSYMAQGETGPLVPEESGLTSETMFCPTPERKERCLEWTAQKENRTYRMEDWFQDNGILFRVLDRDGTVAADSNPFDISPSLAFPPGGRLEVVFAEPCARVTLFLSTFAATMTVRFYKLRTGDLEAVPTYDLIETRQLPWHDFLTRVIYSGGDPVSKLEVEPAAYDVNTEKSLLREMDGLTRQLEEGIELTEEERGRLSEQLETKKKELAELRGPACDRKNWDRKRLEGMQNRLRMDLFACYFRLRRLLKDLNAARFKLEKFSEQMEECLPPFDAENCPVDLDPACWENMVELARIDLCAEIRKRMQRHVDAFCEGYREHYPKLVACYGDIRDQLELETIRLATQIAKLYQEIERLNRKIVQLGELLDAQAQGEEQGHPHFPCGTFVHRICCLSAEDQQFNESIPDQQSIESDYQATVETLEKLLAPIWRPNTRYYCRLQVADSVDGRSPATFDFYYGFRTAGPVGHFHTDRHADYIKPPRGNNPDQYALTNLRTYIDYARSYPNADGNLVQAKPLFFENAELLLFYTRRYVYNMFLSWPEYNGLPALNGSQQVVIVDPAADTTASNPPPPGVVDTEVPRAAVNWVRDEDPRIPRDILTLDTLRHPQQLNPDFPGGSCWDSSGTSPKPAAVYSEIEVENLKPLKLYTAIVNNIFEGVVREVHRYVFRTSRYPNFRAQIDSYRLDDGRGHSRDAVFTMELDVDAAAIDLAHDLVTGNATPAAEALAGQWSHPFDRLIQGALRMTPLDPPVGTEFNIIRQAGTGRRIAVWIRNPEPFNDPKIPNSVLQRSIAVMNGSQVNGSYALLLSKDCSQAVVMPASKSITASSLVFRFIYLAWDGQQYKDQVTVLTNSIDVTGGTP